MDKSQMRVRPGFLLGLFAFLTFFGLLVSSGVPTEKDKQKAQLIATRSNERFIVMRLEEKAGKIGGLTNLTTHFILDSLFDSNQNRIWFNTNAAGELVDFWQTPYRIELAGPTNFVICSAGKDKKFGDADDIIFNSVSNCFVKP